VGFIQFDPRSGNMGFVVDKIALGQVFSEYFRFHCMLHTHLPSGAGMLGTTGGWHTK
jgi:hypothetical protein